MKKGYIKVLPALLCGCMAMACSDMNDLHDKYLQEGEMIYLARFDSISLHPGKERLMVEYWYSDPKAKKCLVTWNMGQDSKEIDMSMSNGETPNVFYIDDLPETTISFDFTAYTEDLQYYSLTSNYTVSVYGDKYTNTLMNATAITGDASFNPLTDEVTFHWTSNYENVVGYLIRYTDRDGKDQEVRVEPNSKKEVVLPNFPEGGTLTYATIYRPQEDAIDEFTTAFSEPFETAGEETWKLIANMSLPQEASAWGWEDVNAFTNQFKFEYTDHGDNNNKGFVGSDTNHNNPHVEIVNDAARGHNVLKLNIHAEGNEDGTVKVLDNVQSSDRQVNMIGSLTGEGNHEACGNYGEHHILHWFMKIPADFKAYKERHYLFQIKAKEDTGGRKGNAVLAINAYADDANGKNSRIEIKHNGDTKDTGNNATLIGNLNLDDFRDEWVEVTFDIVYSHQGELKIKMVRVSDGKVIADYSKTGIDLWRTSCIDMRYNFGFYRYFGSDYKNKKIFPTIGLKSESLYLDNIRIFEQNSNNDNPVVID